MTDTERLSWIEQLLTIFWDGDCEDELMWRPSGNNIFTRQAGEAPDGRIRFAAMCSDTFAWGCADAEDIELPDDLESLRQAVADSKAAEAAHEEFVWVDWVTLWCCRKRGMRPMNAWLKKHAKHSAELALFEATGPPRESEFGAP